VEVGKAMWLPSFKRKNGWLFLKYRDRCWWWDCLIHARANALVAAAVLLRSNALLSLGVMLAIVLVCVALQLMTAQLWCP